MRHANGFLHIKFTHPIFFAHVFRVILYDYYLSIHPCAHCTFHKYFIFRVTITFMYAVLCGYAHLWVFLGDLIEWINFYYNGKRLILIIFLLFFSVLIILLLRALWYIPALYIFNLFVSNFYHNKWMINKYYIFCAFH